MAEQTAPFQQLDFVYTPSRDVATDLGYFSEVLGARVVFAVEAMGTRVAAVQLTDLVHPFRVPAVAIDGTDAGAVHAAMADAVARARSAGGPCESPWSSPAVRTPLLPSGPGPRNTSSSATSICTRTTTPG